MRLPEVRHECLCGGNGERREERKEREKCEMVEVENLLCGNILVTVAAYTHAKRQRVTYLIDGFKIVHNAPCQTFWEVALSVLTYL